MAIPGYTFVDARFSNDQRTMVKSFWTDGNETQEQTIEAKDGDANWVDLLTHIDIDQLHENTYAYIKATQRAFEQKAIQIAKDKGILKDIRDKNVINEAIIKILFEKEEDGDSKNTLFVFKLKLFELEFVKNCKTKKLKSDLRKAKNIREALNVAIKIFEESN
tara:strand:- start:2999 stop:3487 length:489 start_codon:yes stop_codon:yes gene_type:complete